MAEDKDNNREESTSHAGAAPPPESVAEEYRCLTATIAAVTIPAAAVAKPVATAWANQKFSQEGKPQDPPPQEVPKTD